MKQTLPKVYEEEPEDKSGRDSHEIARDAIKRWYEESQKYQESQTHFPHFAYQ